MKREIKAGATDQTVDVFIQDSSVTTGAGLTGLVFNSAGLVCYFRRGATGSATALTLATQTVGGAHSDGGFVEVSAANTPGVYRLDLSDAIVAAGVPYVVVMLKGATNMAPVVLELSLVDFDPTTAKVDFADALLDRNMATGTDSGSPTVRTVRQALRFLRNKWALSAGVLTVNKEDDTTASWTSAIGTTAGANPISSSDPAS
jgi:hypothetical protein